MMLHVYGIPNCDTVKKAVSWLNENKLPYTFHDYKKEGITNEKLKAWCTELGWQQVFNSRSSTWKKINDNYVQDLNEQHAIAIMQENTSIIKRPIIECKNKILLGFNENEYIETILNNK